MNAVNSDQYDEISGDEISGFANTTNLLTTKFPSLFSPILLLLMRVISGSISQLISI